MVRKTGRGVGGMEHEEKDFTITAEPFTWTDKMSEAAMESLNSSNLGYCAKTEIGMALAKLELLENLQEKLKDLIKNIRNREDFISSKDEVVDMLEELLLSDNVVENKVKKTNADCIRAMSDEELADIFIEYDCDYAGYVISFPIKSIMKLQNKCYETREEAKHDFIAWLQSESEE